MNIRSLTAPQASEVRSFAQHIEHGASTGRLKRKASPRTIELTDKARQLYAAQKEGRTGANEAHLEELRNKSGWLAKRGR